MKKLILIIIAATFITSGVFAQAIPNGGFESWNLTLWSNPAYYSTSNAQTILKAGGIANVSEVAGWTSGVNGVQLTTEVTSVGDTVPAYITNSINNPLMGKGGVPYNQKPTGVEIWYGCNEVAGDSAGIIICFKKGGVIMDTFLYAFKGTVANYSAQTFTFSPALNFTPDTVIFAATSSIDILRNKNGHAGSTFTLSGITFQGVDSQTVSMNGNFTSWVSDSLFDPQGWSVSGFPGVARTSDSYSGNYALKLTTTANSNNNDTAQWGGATTGVFNNNYYYGITGGQPYTKTRDTMDFFYKYYQAASGVDSGWVEEDFVRKGTVVLDLYLQLPPTSGYVHYGLIDSVGGGAPDSVIVTFYSSSYNTPPQNSIGSYLEVDNVEFRSQPLSGIKPVLMADNNILIYPNPASTQLTVASAQSNINEVRLVNIIGQTMMDRHYPDGFAGDHESIDISTLPTGMYFITVTSGNITSTGKISISR